MGSYAKHKKIKARRRSSQRLDRFSWLKTYRNTLKFGLFITFIDSKRKSSQRCQQPGPCPAHQNGWHQDKKGQVSAIQVVEIVCSRGANSRLQPSSFTACNYALGGGGARWTRTARTFKTWEGMRSCFITASRVREGVGRRRPPIAPHKPPVLLCSRRIARLLAKTGFCMVGVVTCSHLCTPAKTGTAVLPKS